MRPTVLGIRPAELLLGGGVGVALGIEDDVATGAGDELAVTGGGGPFPFAGNGPPEPPPPPPPQAASKANTAYETSVLHSRTP